MRPSNREIVAALDRVNWDFPRVTTPRGSVHALHWFPGNFIPEIPRYFIQLLSAPHELVLDCYSGSGTTAVEAMSCGRRSVACDVNLASLQVTLGKIAAISPTRNDAALGALLTELAWDSLCVSSALGMNGEGSSPDLGQWFHRDTLGQLRYLWQLIERHARESTSRALLEMLFSDVLFKCASPSGAITQTGGHRRHHWGWVADNVTPKVPARQNAVAIFRAALAAVLRVPRAPGESMVPLVLRQDARHVALASGSADLIVTSPPYAGVIDYALANRLTYKWMNWSLEADRSLEIGSRRNRARVGFLDNYLRQMDAAVERMVDVLKPGGYCAVVIGGSRKFPTAGAHVLESFGSRCEAVWGPRVRAQQRRRVADRLGRPSVELVAVFQRP